MMVGGEVAGLLCLTGEWETGPWAKPFQQMSTKEKTQCVGVKQIGGHVSSTEQQTFKVKPYWRLRE